MMSRRSFQCMLLAVVSLRMDASSQGAEPRKIELRDLPLLFADNSRACFLSGDHRSPNQPMNQIARNEDI